jgi:gamma-glutamyltranspeptidase/glutathione hydrolase
MPDRLLLEGGFSPDTIRLLQTMGHNVQPSRASGSVQSVGIEPSSKTFIGASDPRRSGAKTIGVLESGQLIEN